MPKLTERQELLLSELKDRSKVKFELLLKDVETAKLTGSDADYVYAAGKFVEFAKSVLAESDKISSKGGV